MVNHSNVSFDQVRFISPLEGGDKLVEAEVTFTHRDGTSSSHCITYNPSGDYDFSSRPESITEIFNQSISLKQNIAELLEGHVRGVFDHEGAPLGESSTYGEVERGAEKVKDLMKNFEGFPHSPEDKEERLNNESPLSQKSVSPPLAKSTIPAKMRAEGKFSKDDSELDKGIIEKLRREALSQDLSISLQSPPLNAKPLHNVPTSSQGQVESPFFSRKTEGQEKQRGALYNLSPPLETIEEEGLKEEDSLQKENEIPRNEQRLEERDRESQTKEANTASLMGVRWDIDSSLAGEDSTIKLQIALQKAEDEPLESENSLLSFYQEKGCDLESMNDLERTAFLNLYEKCKKQSKNMEEKIRVLKMFPASEMSVKEVRFRGAIIASKISGKGGNKHEVLSKKLDGWMTKRATASSISNDPDFEKAKEKYQELLDKGEEGISSENIRFLQDFHQMDLLMHMDQKFYGSDGNKDYLQAFLREGEYSSNKNSFESRGASFKREGLDRCLKDFVDKEFNVGNLKGETIAFQAPSQSLHLEYPLEEASHSPSNEGLLNNIKTRRTGVRRGLEELETSFKGAVEARYGKVDFQRIMESFKEGTVSEEFFSRFEEGGASLLKEIVYPYLVLDAQDRKLEELEKGIETDLQNIQEGKLEEGPSLEKNLSVLKSSLKFLSSPASSQDISGLATVPRSKGEAQIFKSVIQNMVRGGGKASEPFSQEQVQVICKFGMAAGSEKEESIDLAAGMGKTVLSRVAYDLLFDKDKQPVVIHIAPFALSGEDKSGKEYALLTKGNLGKIETDETQKHYFITAEEMNALLSSPEGKNISRDAVFVMDEWHSAKYEEKGSPEQKELLAVKDKLRSMKCNRRILMSATPPDAIEKAKAKIREKKLKKLKKNIGNEEESNAVRAKEVEYSKKAEKLERKRAEIKKELTRIGEENFLKGPHQGGFAEKMAFSLKQSEIKEEGNYLLEMPDLTLERGNAEGSVDHLVKIIQEEEGVGKPLTVLLNTPEGKLVRYDISEQSIEGPKAYSKKASDFHERVLCFYTSDSVGGDFDQYSRDNIKGQTIVYDEVPKEVDLYQNLRRRRPGGKNGECSPKIILHSEEAKITNGNEFKIGAKNVTKMKKAETKRAFFKSHAEKNIKSLLLKFVDPIKNDKESLNSSGMSDKDIHEMIEKEMEVFRENSCYLDDKGSPKEVLQSLQEKVQKSMENIKKGLNDIYKQKENERTEKLLSSLTGKGESSVQKEVLGKLIKKAYVENCIKGNTERQLKSGIIDYLKKKTKEGGKMKVSEFVKNLLKAIGTDAKEIGAKCEVLNKFFDPVLQKRVESAFEGKSDPNPPMMSDTYNKFIVLEDNKNKLWKELSDQKKIEEELKGLQGDVFGGDDPFARKKRTVLKEIIRMNKELSKK